MSIFYKVTAPNGENSYLFGTIPEIAESTVRFPVEVKTALDKASHCIFEVNTNALENPQLEGLHQWIAAQKPHIPQIPPAYFASAKKNIKPLVDQMVKKNPNMALKLDAILENIHWFPPIQIASAMVYASLANPMIFPEGRLIHLAEFENKKLGYLTSVDDTKAAAYGFQFNILEQVIIYHYIESLVANGKWASLFEDIRLAYVEQNILKLGQLQIPDLSLPCENPELVRQYYEVGYLKRALEIATGMIPHLETGNALVVISAALLSEVTRMLSAMGYAIEAIPLEGHYFSVDEVMKRSEDEASAKFEDTDTPISPPPPTAASTASSSTYPGLFRLDSKPAEAQDEGAYQIISTDDPSSDQDNRCV